MRSFFTIVLVLLIAGAGAYYYLQTHKAEDQTLRTPDTEPLTLPQETTPEIKHPITEPPVYFDSDAGNATEESTTETEVEEPLPLLGESDEKIKEILSRNFGGNLLDHILTQTGLVHRFVVTVDSLPRKKLPTKYRFLPPAAGKFLVKKDPSGKIILDQDNFSRYDEFIHLLNTVDAEQFVRWYKHFYPLIQQAYDELGYKNRYFNDRFIFVIDHLLETPTIDDPIRLAQPHVFYQYADPALEALSAGQKILLRIGPANMAIVKAKLTKIRRALAAPEIE